jgi:hypothetical protein
VSNLICPATGLDGRTPVGPVGISNQLSLSVAVFIVFNENFLSLFTL